MGIKCCKPCVPPKRYPGCHSTCPDYIKEKAEDEKKNEAIRKQRKLDAGIRDQLIRGMQKSKKRRKT